MSRIVRLSENKRPDRRRARTVRQFSEALVALTLEHGYDAVRVEDIAERADLARATFYLHFDNKDDLLLHTLRAVIDDLAAQIAAPAYDPLHPDGQTPARIAFRHAAEHRALYRVMLQSKAAVALVEQLKLHLAQIIQARAALALPESDAQRPAFPRDVLGQYLASALLGLIVWWLEAQPAFTPDEMAAYFRQLSAGAVAQALQHAARPAGDL